MVLKKTAITALLVLLAVLSFTILAPWASDPQTHRHSIEQTDEKISTVMKLSGGAAAASATLSLLPGDMCTPIAEQLAELAKYFVLILSSLYLEKFLISISGYITFSILFPCALLVVCAVVVTGKKRYLGTAMKIAIVGLIIFFIVPTSVWLSDKVYQTQASKVNDTIDKYNELEIKGDSGSGLLNELSTITSDTLDRITAFTDNLLESIAVMIVTSCVIPLLVLVFLIWLVKTVFSANVLTLDPSSLEMLTQKPG